MFKIHLKNHLNFDQANVRDNHTSRHWVKNHCKGDVSVFLKYCANMSVMVALKPLNSCMNVLPSSRKFRRENWY